MPELFFAHGMGGSPADWLWVGEQLPDLAHAIKLDANAPSPAACAAAMARELRSRAKPPWALVGYSMGGRISLLALEVLAHFGVPPPSHLVLVSAGLGLRTEEEREERRRKDAAWADLAAADPDEFWLQWYAQDLFASFRGLPPGHREEWERARNSMDIGALSNQLRSLGPGSHGSLFPLLAALPGRGVRVLYIVGDLDKKYVELSKKVGEIDGISVETIPGAGHILPLEAPAALAASILRFVEAG